MHVEAHLASARLPFQVDANVGDPIWPSPTTVAVPRLPGGEPIELRGYPMHMVHAEKIVTPEQFASVLEVVIAFADPVLTGSARDRTWNHETGVWE
ncbi:hypothetical protein [Intrasporangium mesophilum]